MSSTFAVKHSKTTTRSLIGAAMLVALGVGCTEGSGKPPVTSVGGSKSGSSEGGSSGGGADQGGTDQGGTDQGGNTGAAKGGTSSGGTSSASTTSAGIGGSTNPGSSPASGTWKIMMLGDSITATTCYPQLFSKNLIDAGHKNFSLIGGVLNNQSCGATNVMTEGHSSKLVVTETNSGNVATWLTTNPPDAVVMHFATNDVWGNGGTTTANSILAAYSTILTKLRELNPNAVLFVIQIIPVNPSPATAASPANYQATLDSLIPAWASANSTKESPVIAVNMENIFPNGYFIGSTYTSDGVHPSPSGSLLMASTLVPYVLANLPGI